MVVYVDLTFMINVIIDSFLLMTTVMITRQKIRILRILVAAVIGSLYVVFLLFMPNSWLSNAMIKFFVSALLLRIATPISSIFTFLRLIAVFYVVTFAVGGTVIALHTLFFATNSYAGFTLLDHHLIWMSNVGLLFIVISLPFAFMLITWLFTAYRQRMLRPVIARITIRSFGKQVTVKGLFDTGNRVVDPLFHHPVMVVQLRAIQEQLPKALYELILESTDLSYERLVQLDGDIARRITIVPYSAVGTARGQLIAYRPDDVMVQVSRHQKSIMPMLVAVISSELSPDQSFEAIVPVIDQDLVEKGMHDDESMGKNASEVENSFASPLT